MRTLILGLALIAPVQAHALSCAWGPWEAFPADGTTDVPVNTVPRVFFENSQVEDFSIELLDADDNAHAITTEEHVQGTNSMISLVLDGDLAPSTRYEIVITHDDQNEIMRYRFTTSADSDAEAPATPVVQELERDRSKSEWGTTDMIRAQLDDPGEPTLHELHLTDAAGTDLGVVYDIGYEDSGAHVLSVGEGLCGTDVELDGSVDVTVKAIDLAGNVSGETAPQTAAGGGCSSVAAPASLVALFLPLALAFRRRRVTP